MGPHPISRVRKCLFLVGENELSPFFNGAAKRSIEKRLVAQRFSAVNIPFSYSSREQFLDLCRQEIETPTYVAP